jgi:hypothetical protein
MLLVYRIDIVALARHTACPALARRASLVLVGNNLASNALVAKALALIRERPFLLLRYFTLRTSGN